MNVANRLRAFREYKDLSQVQMEQRLGLSRYHISRIENGRAIPTLETLHGFARVFEVPLFHLFYEEGEPYDLPILPFPVQSQEQSDRRFKKDERLLRSLTSLLERLPRREKKLLLSLAQQMVRQHSVVVKRERTLLKGRQKRRGSLFLRRQTPTAKPKEQSTTRLTNV